VRLILVRHGATEWSRSGQHTGRTDLPLTPEGIAEGRDAAPVLRAVLDGFGGGPHRVVSSPLQRALATAALMSPGAAIEVVDDLAEMDYGLYEGRTKEQIRADRPGWDIWRDGCPGGETVDDVGRRADRFLAGILEAEIVAGASTVVAFSHGHTLRIVAARALGLPAAEGRRFIADTASVSVVDGLGGDADGGEAAVRLWNRTPEARSTT
jgi:probable phosphoglycerate mutase